MAKRPSSRRWLQRHVDDEYVKRARADGYRSRAAYKFIEIDDRDRLLRPGMTVVDLGAAPGGWSQVAAQRVGDKGMVVALDILPMDPLGDVRVLKGDFTDENVLENLLAALGERKIDLVISDMAPNISGMAAVDQPRAMYLAELTLDLARQTLAPNGDLLVKVFQGEGFEHFYKEVRQCFAKTVIRKPKASRAKSREMYLLARRYKV